MINQRKPRWLRAGTRENVIFWGVWVAGAYVVNALFYLLTSDTLDSIGGLILLSLFGLGMVQSSFSAYRREGRRTLQQRGPAAPSFVYAPFPPLYVKGVFVVLVWSMSGAFWFSAGTLVPGLRENTAILLSIVLLSSTLGGYLAYRITKTKWLVKALFTSLMIAGFAVAAVIAAIGIESVPGLFLDAKVINVIILISAAIGGYSGYRITKTERFASLESRFLSVYGVYDTEQDNDDADHQS